MPLQWRDQVRVVQQGAEGVKGALVGWGRMRAAQRGFSHLLLHLGSPANAPKPCGHSPGRPSGTRSPPAMRFPAVTLTPSSALIAPVPLLFDLELAIAPVASHLLLVKMQA